ncbi:MAG TPA: TIGR01777 family oxidoreductase [Gemmatimonadales bacterium]|nr:TIGR01777 family oxidoreductase [Gemmatimonadales bacterium]
MKIVIPGGSGQVGTVLARAFHAAGDEVILLSRSPALAPWRVVSWDPPSIGPWAEELNDADVVINLAGRNVNCRYTAASRREIMESRVASTVAVGAAIERAARPPALWLQASTATIYAHRFDASNDEATGQIGGHEPGAPASWHFSIEVAQNWERACNAARVPHTRRVLMRSAVIMSPDRGGIFDTLLSLVRGGLGGRAGNGRQYVSWIHDADFIRAVQFVIKHESITGPVNIAAPNPLPNAEFMRDLRRAWGTPIGLPATRWMLAIGAYVIRTETELVLKSRRVVAGRLAALGFQFTFPTWAEAATDLCARWREAR